jgi:NADPH-dependent curcumin reductase CurA
MRQTNSGWVLARRPAAELGADDLRLVETDLPPLREDDIKIKNLYLSLDPTNRIAMSDRAQYSPPVGLGAVMRGVTLGIVEESRSPLFAPGDIVLTGEGGWREYAIVKDRQARKIQPQAGIPLTAYLSVLGSKGLTAYFGLLDICAPAPGDTLVVSAAAGAVGSIAGQIGKIKGCRVIGIAGGAEKCRWITQDLGFDAAIDYKSEIVGQALDRLCPNGIDISFENVGGAIMDAVFARLALHGRMSVCGLISSYNTVGPMRGPEDFGRILMQRLTVRGFIIVDYVERFPEALAALSGWVEAGQIKWRDHVLEGGIAAAPAALGRLFSGDHDGKLMLRIAPEPELSR